MTIALRLFLQLLLLLATTPAWAQLAPCTIETIAGDQRTSWGDGGPASEAELRGVSGVAFGPDGSLVATDLLDNVIRRIDSEGTISTIAGNGLNEVSGDRDPALAAGIRNPLYPQFGPDGSLYFHDVGPRVRRIAPDGTITTVAGGDRAGYFGDGGPAVAAGWVGPSHFAVGPDGSIWIASQAQHRIRRVRPNGIIETAAGANDPYTTRGAYSGDGGPAVEAGIESPRRIAVAPDGTVYFLDGRLGDRVRRIRPDGTIDTYLSGEGSDREDGSLRSTHRFVSARRDLHVDAEGRLYWDESSRDLRRVGLDDTIETVWQSAGEATLGASFSRSAAGEFYVPFGRQILRLAEDGESEAVAGAASVADGDGGPFRDAALGRIRGFAFGLDGALYLASNSGGRVRVVRNGGIQTFAGTGETGVSAGDGGPALEARFRQVVDVAVASDGTVLIADDASVRRVDSAGMIETVAGALRDCTSSSGDTCGDGGPAAEAALPGIVQISADGAGRIYVLHRDPRGNGNQWVRVISSDGTISRLPEGPIGEGVTSMALDEDDRLVVAERFGRIYRQTESGGDMQLVSERLDPFATDALAVAEDFVYHGTGRNGVRRHAPGGSLDLLLQERAADTVAGDGGPPRSAVSGAVSAIAADPDGNLYVADSDNRVIRRINRPSACPQVDRPRIAGIRNGASFAAASAPGTLISIFGEGLGPSEPLSAGITGDGRLPTELGGVELDIDGRPAPLVFVSDGQINAVVPHQTPFNGRYRRNSRGLFYQPFGSVEAVLTRDGVDSDISLWRALGPAAPAFFLLDADGQAAALNQDGSINGTASPAQEGSVVAAFATGGGATDPPGVDGLITTDVLRRPLEQVRVFVDGIEAEVLYAGAAPGLVSGVLQVNFRMPTTGSTGPRRVTLQVGLISSETTQTAQISAAP